MRYLTLIFLLLFTLSLFADDDKGKEVDFVSANEVVLDGEYLVNSLNWMLVEKYFDDSDFAAAIEILERIISLDPSDIEAYSTLSWLLISEEREEEALKVYTKMVEKNKDSAAANFEMGFYYYRLNDLEKAKPWMKKSFELFFEPPKIYIYGSILEALGEDEELKAFWEEMAKRYPENEFIQQKLSD